MPYRTELKRPDLKGQFPCTVCGKIFCHSSSLSRHRMQAHFKSYTCTQCNQEISSNDTLRTHMYKYHQISRMFMCRCCNWAFPDKTSLHIHMQSMIRCGRPGDVSVLARSSVEGECIGITTHSPSSSPHDDGTHFQNASVSPSEVNGEAQKLTSSPPSMPKAAANSLLNNSATDLFTNLTAALAATNTTKSMQNLLTSKLNNSNLLPSNTTAVNSPQTQQSNTIFPANLIQTELLKTLKNKSFNSTNGNTTNSFINVLNSVNLANRQINALKNINEIQNQQIIGTQNPWFLNWLRNNPFGNLENGNKFSQEKAALLTAAFSAARSQSSNTNTSTSNADQSTITSKNTSEEHFTDLNTSSINSNANFTPEISHLLCVAQSPQQQIPSVKRPRISSLNSSLNSTNLANTTKSNATAAIVALNASKQQLLQNRNFSNEDLQQLINDSQQTAALNDNLNLNFSINNGSKTLPFTQLNITTNGINGTGAMSSTASSPRASTPTQRKLNSVIDKISSKLDNSSKNSSNSFLNNDNETGSKSGNENISSRRNKRKARVPQQLTPQATETNSEAKSKLKEENTTEKHLPSAKSSTLDNFAKLVQTSSTKNTLSQLANVVGGSEQPSPTVSDSHTSVSGSSAATQLMELIGATNATLSPKKFCNQCKDYDQKYDYYRSRIKELEEKLKNYNNYKSNQGCDEQTMTDLLPTTGEEARIETQVKQLKERLMSIAECSTKAIFELQQSREQAGHREAAAETSQVDVLLNCLKGIEEIASINFEETEEYDFENEHENFLKSKPLLTANSTGLDEEECEEESVGDEIMDEDDDGTIEILCGPSPESSVAEEEFITKNGKNIMEKEQEIEAVQIKLQTMEAK